MVTVFPRAGSLGQAVKQSVQRRQRPRIALTGICQWITVRVSLTKSEGRESQDGSRDGYILSSHGDENGNRQ